MGSKMKRGQVTIFIILAIVIVFVIIAITMLIGGDLGTFFSGELDTRAEISACIDQAIYPKVGEILQKGGVLNPEKTIRYRGENYTYLVYTSADYEKGYILYPALRQQARDSLEDETRSAVEECFSQTLTEQRDRGYSIQEEALNYSIELVPSAIIIIINKPLTISKEDSVKTLDDFSFEIKSELYNLLTTTSEIANSHAQFCSFDSAQYTMLYRNYRIRSKPYDYSEVYSVKDIYSNEEIKFATRSCVTR